MLSLLLEILPKFLWGCVLCLSIIYLYFKLVFYSYWRRRNVPYKEPSTPFGSIAKVILDKDSLGDRFRALYSEFEGEAFFGAYAFYKPVLVLRDPGLIHCILTNNFTEFHDRGIYYSQELDPMISHLFFLPGEKWKIMRVRLSPVFTSGKMKQIFSLIQDSADKYTKTLEQFAKQSMVIDVKEISSRFTTKVITAFVFGIESDVIENPDAEIRTWGAKIFTSESLKRNLAFFAPSILIFFRMTLLKKGVSNFFQNLFNESVEYRDKHNVTRGDFLDLLRNEMKKLEIPNEGDSKLKEIEAAAQAFGFFAAGFETTLSAITHCLYELSINTDIQERTREDIDKNLEKNDRKLDYEVLKNMHYLNKVVRETIRKYPSVGILNRVCTQEFQIPKSDVKIEKGTAVVIPVLGLHMDSKYYPDPEKFDPERFNSENIANRKPYTYLPFGGGPRICIGQRLALLQLEIAIVLLLSRYRFSLCEETKRTLKYNSANVVYILDHPMKLRIDMR